MLMLEWVVSSSMSLHAMEDERLLLCFLLLAYQGA
jgi:hypothetical protein